MKLAIVSAILLAHTFLASAQVYSYCDLRLPETTEDPTVVLDTQLSDPRFDAARLLYPREAVQQALARDTGAGAFIQAQALARNQSQQQSPSRNPSRNVERPASDRKYSAPEVYEGLCQEQESRVLGKILPTDDGLDVQFCHVVEDQALSATTCRNHECDVHNDFNFYQKYYCVPDSYVFESAMVFCSDTNYLGFETFKIPIQCVCKKYNCNVDGMNI